MDHGRSDTQSFPFEVKSSPRLWDGAYSSQEKFSQLDVASVVEFARLRGVRVMVEFDMPGHAGSWCAGYPEICPSPTCLQPLNVANPATFTKIEAMLHECTGGVASAPGKPSPGVFKDNFVSNFRSCSSVRSQSRQCAQKVSPAVSPPS